MTDYQTCLRWNKHHLNFISGFKNLLDDKELVDVTLSVDGQQIKAHKVILSACSSYFKSIFTEYPCEHPVVILGDVKFKDLKVIIDFMYCGEINISDKQLPDVLEVAEALHVRGLFPNKKLNTKKDQRTSEDKKEKEATRTCMSESIIMEKINNPSNEINPTSSATFSPVTAMETENCGPSIENHPDPDVPLGVKAINDLSNDSVCQQEIEDKWAAYFKELGEFHFNHRDSSNHSEPSPYNNSDDPPRTLRRDMSVRQSKNFHLALEAVRSGELGFCKAAKIYGVSNSTLWLEYKKRGYPKRRPQPSGLKMSQSGSC